MNLQQLLNMDMATVGKSLRRGFSWWTAELAELTPASMRRPSRRRVRPIAELSSEGVRLWRDGEATAVVRSPNGALNAVDLVLPEGAALVQTLDLPRLPGSDLRAFLQFNMDRFTPFQAAEVYADAIVLPEAGALERQPVRLAVIVRTRAEALLAELDGLGLRVVRMAVGHAADPRSLQFDFMRAILAERGGDLSGRRRTRLWVACLAALMVNLAIAYARDASDLAQLQRLVDLQQPAVSLTSRLRANIAGERSRRLLLLSQRTARDPLHVLDAVTRSLPPGEWVQRFELTGRQVRLAGSKTNGFDVLAALKPPAFANPRSLTADITTHGPGGEPFDVAADVPDRGRP
jgi:general secretion pathway protein L